MWRDHWREEPGWYVSVGIPGTRSVVSIRFSHYRDSIYNNKWKWKSMTFTVICDNDDIIDCNKWHFDRYLNPWLLLLFIKDLFIMNR